MAARRKCSACAVQVLVDTACLRAFCFCVIIGTNALESFNGSISARVSERSDFFISHVGRAQLALLKRCYPVGYCEVVRYLRGACGLPPLTDRAEKDALVHQRRAAQLHGDATVWDSESVRQASEKKLKTKAIRSTTQTKDGKLVKIANEVSCAALEEKNSRVGGLEGGVGGSDRGASSQKRARGEGGCTDGLLVYDRSGSNATRNFNESMVVPSTAKEVSKQRTCKECERRGVSVTEPLAVGHKEASLARCAGVQRAWIERGGQLSHPETSRPATGPTPTTPRKAVR